MFLPSSLFYLLYIIAVIGIGEAKNNASIVKEFTYVLYTEHEMNQIEMLREAAKNLLDIPYMTTNKYLINWIRDSPTDFTVAYQKLLKFWTYRKNSDLDTIQNEDWSGWVKKYPFAIFGKDFNGCIVAGIDIGAWRLRKAVLGNPKQFYRYLDWASDHINKAVYDSNCLNGTIIFNLNGYSAREHGCLQCIPSYVHIIGNFDTHYPRVLDKLICINTPRIFQQLLLLIKPVTSPYSVTTFETYGFDRSEWEPIIQSRIPTEILPLEFGGTRNRKVLGDQKK